EASKGPLSVPVDFSIDYLREETQTLCSEKCIKQGGKVHSCRGESEQRQASETGGWGRKEGGEDDLEAASGSKDRPTPGNLSHKHHITMFDPSVEQRDLKQQHGCESTNVSNVEAHIPPMCDVFERSALSVLPSGNVALKHSTASFNKPLRH
ncbi:hypothetical protein NQZ68_025022, partial [Dissostichus eleginoides]